MYTTFSIKFMDLSFILFISVIYIDCSIIVFIILSNRSAEILSVFVTGFIFSLFFNHTHSFSFFTSYICFQVNCLQIIFLFYFSNLFLFLIVYLSIIIKIILFHLLFVLFFCFMYCIYWCYCL